MEVSPYYKESVKLGSQFQEENKSWTGYDVVKYQKKIYDLVKRYNAKTILDYGCGKGLQYTEPLPYGAEPGIELPENQWQTFDQYLGVKVFKYDPCVKGLRRRPPKNKKFDGVICTQVLNSIPDDDLIWVRELLERHARKFCFIGLNFQREAKGKKPCTIPHTFVSLGHESFLKNTTPTGPAVICSGGSRIARTILVGTKTNSTALGKMCPQNGLISMNL